MKAEFFAALGVSRKNELTTENPEYLFINLFYSSSFFFLDDFFPPLSNSTTEALKILSFFLFRFFLTIFF
eukprot:m.225848 g.225848  ORF g.225848 m.225848 type:complete len:70 (+) comp22354_c5_seq1:99-308(+)